MPGVETADRALNADQILDVLRPVVAVIDAIGTITNVRGGYGGFLGHDLDAMVGANVFEFVSPREADELAIYFAESADQSPEAVAFPMPFRVTLMGADGWEHPVDVIQTGWAREDDGWTWVIVLVPISITTALSRSLDAEMAGASPQRVREMLTEELVVENHSYTSRWFLIDLGGSGQASVTTSRPEDEAMAEAIAQEVTERQWRPWQEVARRECAPLLMDQLPVPLQAIARTRGWRRASVAPVYLDRVDPDAVFLTFGRAPDGYDLSAITTNVRARIAMLVDVTALLLARWRDRDRLVAAATRDPLTGLANRDAFSDALAAVGDQTALLYIDIDHFKTVNDRFGHETGDRVLVEVARRIVEACRPTDVVARFGGDEFVVLLDGADTEVARAVGERIIDAVGSASAAAEIERVTVSVGLAALTDKSDVLAAADRAMLQAKQQGRDRLVDAGTEPIPAAGPTDPGP